TRAPARRRAGHTRAPAAPAPPPLPGGPCPAGRARRRPAPRTAARRPAAPPATRARPATPAPLKHMFPSRPTTAGPDFRKSLSARQLRKPLTDSARHAILLARLAQLAHGPTHQEVSRDVHTGRAAPERPRPRWLCV